MNVLVFAHKISHQRKIESKISLFFRISCTKSKQSVLITMNCLYWLPLIYVNFSWSTMEKDFCRNILLKARWGSVIIVFYCNLLSFSLLGALSWMLALLWKISSVTLLFETSIGGIFSKPSHLLEISDLNKGLPSDSVVGTKRSQFPFFPWG